MQDNSKSESIEMESMRLSCLKLQIQDGAFPEGMTMLMARGHRENEPFIRRCVSPVLLPNPLPANVVGT